MKQSQASSDSDDMCQCNWESQNQTPGHRDIKEASLFQKCAKFFSDLSGSEKCLDRPSHLRRLVQD